MPITITRADLTDAIYKLEATPRDSEPEQILSREQCSELLEDILEEVMLQLEDGHQVKISTFGSFVIHDKKQRVGRNPKTGVEAVITPRKTVSFRASAVLKSKLNGHDH